METIFKSFLGIFFLLMLICLGVGVVGASIDARNADISAASYVSRIGCSNYSDEVVAACVADAKARGYELDVSLVRPLDKKRATYGSLTLTYHYQIPVLNLDQEHGIQADIL